MVSIAHILEVNNVSYAYHSLKGETLAINDISFWMEAGEFVSIVGPSGCGKSTLLSLIAGLLVPEKGSVLFPQKRDDSDIINTGYMLQHDYLFEWRSVYENVILGLELKHQLTDKKLAYIDRLLLEYGLDKFKTKRPSELSGGMRQRAALIRTLALEPSLLLLDEPFSALDYQTRLLVSNDICQLIRKAGKSMLIITHDISEAISLSDRVIVLSKRPAVIKSILPIHLTLSDNSLLSARNAPEFAYYFNEIWKELNDEEGG